MELRQLRYFLSVADTRSFVSAANKLFISRQAISKAVSQLESELNVELFMRDSNGAFLTPAGVMFYERVRTLVMELDTLSTDMKNYGTRFHQHIRFAFSIGVMSLFESKLLEYKMTKENLDIQFQEYPENTCMELLAAHKADMVVSTMTTKDPLFTSVKLLESPIGILIQWKHALSELTEVDPSDLSWIPLAIHTDTYSLDFCRKYNLTPQYQGYDYQRLLNLVKEGSCGLLLPYCTTEKLPEDVKWIPVVNAVPWSLYKTYPKSVESNLLFSSVLDELHQHLFSDHDSRFVVSKEYS